MQIAPSELLKLSLWEFSAMVQGWNKANKPTAKEEDLKSDDEDRLFEFIQEEPLWIN